MGTLCGVYRACGSAPSHNLMEYGSPRFPRPLKRDGYCAGQSGSSVPVLVALILEMRLSAAIAGSPNKLVLRPRMTYTGSDTCSLSIDSVPLNCPITFNVRPVGPCRILESLVRVTPLRLLKVCSDIAVTSAPVSILNCVSVPCSCSVTVQEEVFPEFKTPRNAVSRLSSSEVAATVFERH